MKVRNRFFVVASLGASSLLSLPQAAAEEASFRVLQNNTYPFLGMGIPRAMSADGRVVEGDGTRWTEAGGVVPTGFLPGFNFIRSPFALNFDGTVAVGLFYDSASHEGRYWQGPQRTSASIGTLGISGDRGFGPCRMTDDGRWYIGLTDPGSNPARFARDGTIELFPKLGVANARVFATSGDGSVALGYLQRPGGTTPCVAWLVGSGPAQASATIENFDFYGKGLSGNGQVAVGNSKTGLPALWRIGGDIEIFNPPLGVSSVSPSVASENGDMIAGMGNGGAFVRRAGEQARDLRVVLQRFGANEVDYYLLNNYVLSISRDGHTIAGYATSPWYSSFAYVATIPFWEPCPADLNFDGVVDDVDFTVFAGAYDVLVTTDGDLNIDAQTDDSDFVDFVVAYETLLCP